MRTVVHGFSEGGLADSLLFVRGLLAGKPVPQGCEIENGTKP